MNSCSNFKFSTVRQNSASLVYIRVNITPNIEFTPQWYFFEYLKGIR